MNAGRYRILLLLILIACFAISCGKKEPDEMVVSGTIEGQALADHPDKPVMVAIMRNRETISVTAYAVDDIVTMVSADTDNRSFQIDLTESGLIEGDEINLVAFVDMNCADGIPNPDAGDNIGFYIDRESYSPAYALQKGLNNGFHIVINRLIRPFPTEISGTIRGDAAGETLIVAYAGDIDQLDFTGLDPDQVIGYAQQHKGASDQAYTLELLPYPADLQTERVLIVVLLDDTGAGMPAPGNLVGFHTNPAGTVPQYFPVDARRDNPLTGVDIQMRFPDASGARTAEIRIPKPSGDTIILNGHFTFTGDDFNPDEGAVFMIVAKTDNPAGIMDAPFTSVDYFYKMPKGETTYSLDLSDTGLFLEDEVFVVALWDRDYQNGFPDPTPGDVLGYLRNKDELSYITVLSQWQDTFDMLDGWDLSVDKVYYDHQASLEFFIDKIEDTDIVPQPGETVFVVAIPPEGLDNATQIDMDYVVGMESFIVGQDGGPPYSLSLDILPVIYNQIDVGEDGQDPFSLNSLFVFALIDTNGNGKPDLDEYIGYYSQGNPSIWNQINVQDGINVLTRPVHFPYEFTYRTILSRLNAE